MADNMEQIVKVISLMQKLGMKPNDKKGASALMQMSLSNPDQFDAFSYMGTTYGAKAKKFDAATMGNVMAQYDYYKKRTSAGYDPVEIADTNWNPTQHDDDTNEAMGIWYKQNKALPGSYQQAEFTNLLNQYKLQKTTQATEDTHTLAGYKSTDTTPLKFSQDWQKMGYDYDMADPNDVRRKQLGMPPKSFLGLYGEDEEDNLRLRTGQLPKAIDPIARQQKMNDANALQHATPDNPTGAGYRDYSQNPTNTMNGIKAAMGGPDIVGNVVQNVHTAVKQGDSAIQRDPVEAAMYAARGAADPNNRMTSHYAYGKTPEQIDQNYIDLLKHPATFGSGYAAAPQEDVRARGLAMMTKAERDEVNYYYGVGDRKKADLLLDKYMNAHAKEYSEKGAAAAETELATKPGDDAVTRAGKKFVGTAFAMSDFVPAIGVSINTAGTNISNAITGENRPVPESGSSAQLRLANAAENSVTDGMTGFGKYATTVGVQAAKMIPALLLPGGVGATGKVATALSAGFMGATAGGQAAQQATDQGATALQSLLQGTTQGVAESLFEKWSLGQLKAFKPLAEGGAKEFAKALLSGGKYKVLLAELGKLGLVNATEEVATDVSNLLTDQVIMGMMGNGATRSQIEQYYDSQVAQGKTGDAAKWGVFWDVMKQLGNTGAVGAGMGLLLGGGRTAQHIIHMDSVKAQVAAQAQKVAEEVKSIPTKPTAPTSAQSAAGPVTESDPGLSYNPNTGASVKGYDPYYDAVEREWTQAAETVQNHFGTNDLRVDELNSIKDTLGLDLEDISDRYVQAAKLHDLSPLERFEKLLAFGVADQYYPADLIDRYLKNNLPMKAAQQTATQAAQAAESSEFADVVKQPTKAVWHDPLGEDTAVTVTGYTGRHNGEPMFTVEGSKVPLPESELTFVDEKPKIPAEQEPIAPENLRGAATWASVQGDVPVKVTGYAGMRDGQHYYNIEGSKTALPGNKLTFETTVRTAAQKAPKQAANKRGLPKGKINTEKAGVIQRPSTKRTQGVPTNNATATKTAEKKMPEPPRGKSTQDAGANSGRSTRPAQTQETVDTDGNRMKALSEQRRGTLDKTTLQQMKRADQLAKVFGRKVVWHEYITRADGKNVNGYYDRSKDELALSVRTEAGGDSPYAIVAKHELTHFIEGTNAYQELRDYVISGHKKAGTYDAKLAELSALYKSRDVDNVEREIVAQFVERNFLTNDKAIRSFVNQHSGLGGKIVEWFDKIIDKLTQNKMADEARIYSEARELWVKALAETRRTNDNSGIQFSVADEAYPWFKTYSSDEMRNLNSPRIKVNSPGTRFVDFINEVLDNGDVSRFYFGKVPDEAAEKISQAMGHSVTDFNVVIRSDEIRHILKDHGKDEVKKKGEIPITRDILTHLPEVFQNPDTITPLGKKDYAGREAFEIRKTIGGLAVTVVGLSSHRHNLEIDTFWVINKKRPPTTSDGVNPRTTSTTSNGQASIDETISQADETVNDKSHTNNRQFSLTDEREPAPAFYNRSEQIIREKMPNAMPAEQLRGLLREVKPDEMKWLGLDDLIAQGGKITKQEVLDTIAANNLQIEEVKGTAQYRPYVLPGGSNYRELLFTLPNNPGDNYRSSHWKQNNVLAHTRLDDRHGENDNRVLFVEEVQSDWHQDGREQGYNPRPLGAWEVADYKSGKAVKGVATEDEARTWLAEHRDDEAYDGMGLDVLRGGEGYTDGKVPDAPMHKTWHEYVMKRILRMAAEQGYDKVAWTTGDQQNERYTLGNHLKDIVVTPRDDGRYNIVATSHNGEKSINSLGVAEADLPQMLGAEMAQRLTLLPKGQRQELKGLDLRVGGSGMRGFYDKMLTDFMARYIKKWGSKVEYSDVLTGMDTYTPQPSVSITPAMRESVLYEGQPQFSLPPDDELQDYADEFGTIQDGMNPRVDRPALPRQSTKKTKTRKLYRTISESPNLTDEQAKEVRFIAMADQYVPTSDQHAINGATKTIQDIGLRGAHNRWQAVVNGDRPASKELIALGERLLIDAAEHNDIQGMKELASELAIEGTRAGQVLQAMKLVKQMTPIGRLVYMEKIANKLTMEAQKRNLPPVKISDELKEKLAKTKTTAEGEAVMEEIVAELAAQIPSTIADKVNAIRYMCMLGNLRTSMRNIFSNTAMLLMKGTKDTVGLLPELFLKKQDKTKAVVLPGEAAYRYAWKDFDEMKHVLQHSGKYGFTELLEDAKRVFKFKPAEKLRRGISGFLEWQDLGFLRLAYASSFAQVTKARGWDANFLNSGTAEAAKALNTARKIATDEALKATFRDYNVIANKIGQLENTNIITKIAVGGLAPFKRTPMNIIRRGMEYSPLGLIMGMKQAAFDIRSGKKTTAQVLDTVSAGVTGSVVLGVGYLLASMGMLNGDDDKDKEKYYNSDLGSQPYSLRIGDRTYTVDWISPTSMPLFVGVELYNTMRNSGDVVGGLQKLADAMSSVSDPVFQLSMLQTLNDALTSYGSEGGGAIGNAAIATVQGYAGQFVPTILGQAARTLDDTRRTSYAPKDSPYTKGGESFGRKQLARIPEVSRNMEPYVDKWGREQNDTDNLGVRAAKNLVSPGYVAQDKTTAADREIQRLYKTSGNIKVLPGSSDGNLRDNDGKDYYLTAQEMTRYAKTKGQESYSIVSDFLNDGAYRKLADDQKETAIGYAYDYGRVRATVDYFKAKGIKYEPPSWYTKTLDVVASGVPLETYLAYRVVYGDLAADQDADGNSINGTKKKKVVAFVDGLSIPDADKQGLLDSSYKRKDSSSQSIPTSTRKKVTK